MDKQILHPIYLDYNATTPVDPRVLEKMLPFFTEEFGNSVSAAHAYGWKAESAVDASRKQIADLLHCQTSEIFFTSGATEGNNWALRGVIDNLRSQYSEEIIEVISSPIEHSSVVKFLQWLESLPLNMGFRVKWLQPSTDGIVSPESLQNAITAQTKLISLMWVNNEIGSVNPIAELASVARNHKIYFHTDATQAIGKVPVNLESTPVDLMSFSGHKIYGPKGIGALYIRGKNPKVQLLPLMYGGGHEHGLRSGTLNVPGIVGLGEACNIIKLNQNIEIENLLKLQNYFWTKLKTKIPLIKLNGPPIGTRVCNNLNITFKGLQPFPPSFAKIAVSRGSACMSGKTSMSPVLKNIGLTMDEADLTLRLSLGRWTKLEDLENVILTHFDK